MSKLESRSPDTPDVSEAAPSARLRKVIARKVLKSRAQNYEPTMVTVSIADLEALLSQSTTDTQRLTEENAELRKENERLQSWLNTPTIVGLEDCGYFAEVDYDGLKDHLVGVNEPMRLDWANRLVDGEWYAANIVTIWNEDGDWEETELHLYASKQLAQQAVDASVALRPSTIPEGSTRG